jgi:hypothetical protein
MTEMDAGSGAVWSWRTRVWAVRLKLVVLAEAGLRVRTSETVKLLELGESVLDPEFGDVTPTLGLVLTSRAAVSEPGLKGELRVATAEAATQLLVPLAPPVPLVHWSVPVIEKFVACETIPPPW